LADKRIRELTEKASIVATDQIVVDSDALPEAKRVSFATISALFAWGNILGTLSDQTDVQNALNAKLPESASIVAVSGSRDLATTDAGKILEATGTITITAPNGLATGFQCVIVNVGSGTIALAATTTLQSKDSANELANQYGAATIYHRGSNVWVAIGDLS
jgi:hypothetical protein